jgi:hypothetical protein
MFTILVLTAIVVPALFIGHVAYSNPQPQKAPVRAVRRR